MDGYRLSLVRLVDTDASKVDFVRDMKVFTAALEFELILDPFHKGLIAIFDASGFHIGYIPKINLAIANLALKCCQVILINFCNFIIDRRGRANPFFFFNICSLWKEK